MKKFMMITLFFLSNEFLVSQDQDIERLTSADLEKILTEDHAQEFIQRISDFSHKSGKELEYYLTDPVNKKAKSMIECLMHNRSNYEDSIRRFNGPFPHLSQKEARQAELELMYQQHLVLTCSDCALERIKSRNNHKCSQFQKITSNTFFKLGSLVTHTKELSDAQDRPEGDSEDFVKSQKKFHEFMDKRFVRPEDEATQKICRDYQSSFSRKKNELMVAIDLDKFTQSMICAVAVHNQSAIHALENVETDVEYRSRAIKNGKKVTLGLGIVAVGTSAWLLSRQLSK